MSELAGRVCLVTGATSGIGLVTARDLAVLGATVVLVGRDERRGRDAVAAVEAAAGRGRAELIVGDLAVQGDVRRVAGEFAARHQTLDVLVNNAGAVFEERALTSDGVERTFALNHLAYFLLTALLRPALERAPAARVVSVSSDAHRALPALEFDNLQGERRYTGMRAYSQSKLANVLFAYELARRLAGTRVTSNAVHPGAVRTGFGRNNRGAIGVLFRLVGPLLLTPEKGARTSVYVASSGEVAGVTGAYFAKRRAVKSSPASYDEGAARRLWEVSERLTGLAPSA